MNLIVDNWTDADTDSFAEWFVMDPLLSKQVGFDHPVIRGELEVFILTLITEELNDQSFLRAVRDEDGLVGFLCVRNRYNVTGVCHIAVAPWQRGHGVEIVKAGIEAAKQDGRLKKLVAFPIGVPRKLQERFLNRVGFKKTFVVGEMDI